MDFFSNVFINVLKHQNLLQWILNGGTEIRKLERDRVWDQESSLIKDSNWGQHTTALYIGALPARLSTTDISHLC